MSTDSRPDEPDGFARPAGWTPLAGDPSAPPRHAIAPPPTAPARPAAPAPASYAPTYPRRTAPTPRRGAIRAVLGLVGALVLLLALPALLRLPSGQQGGRPPASAPGTSPTGRPGAPGPVTAPIEAAWHVKTASLRADLPDAKLIPSPDGVFDSSSVVDAGSAWIVLTGDNQSDDTIVVHALDPGSGRELWQLDLPGARCASRLLGGKLACVVMRDSSTRPGTVAGWRVALLEPATGEEARARNIDGAFTQAIVRGDRLVLVEQRQPAPHAVLTGLGRDLKQVWRLDLADAPGADGLFSTNRIINRREGLPDGPTLDRPRVRAVGRGLTALWAGSRTLFFDAATGRLVALPRCSRLVDDGRRIWCNEPERATSYSYGLKRLAQTETGVRLAFPDRDARDGDVTPAVFLEPEGAVVKVDPATGKTRGILFPSEYGEAFGMAIAPRVVMSGGITLLTHAHGLASLDMAAQRVRWERLGNETASRIARRGDEVLLLDFTIRVLDVRTGDVRAERRQSIGLYTEPLGERLVATGPEEIALLRYP